MGEHLLCKQEVIGSNPFASTTSAGVHQTRWLDRDFERLLRIVPGRGWSDLGARGNRFWRVAFGAAGRFCSLAL